MIATFTLFDVRNFATTQPLRMILPLALVVLFGASVPIPGAPIVIAALIASITTSYYFQGDERGMLDTLYAASSISGPAVVIGRYISALIFAAAAVGLGAATTVVMTAVRHQSLSWPLALGMLVAAFGIVSVALAVQLPWFFALGFTRGRPMIYIPVGILSIAGFVAGQTGFLDGSIQITSSGVPLALVSILIVAFGCAVIAVSIAIAVRLYRKREL